MLYCYLAAVVLSTAPGALSVNECPNVPFLTYQVLLEALLLEDKYPRDCELEEEALNEAVRALYDVSNNRSDISSICEKIVEASADCKQCFVYVAQTRSDIVAAQEIGPKLVEEVKTKYGRGPIGCGISNRKVNNTDTSLVVCLARLSRKEDD